MLAIVARLSYVGDQVDEMSSIARMRSNATRELEISVTEYAAAVHECSRAGDPAARADAAAEALEVAARTGGVRAAASRPRRAAVVSPTGPGVLRSADHGAMRV